ncbi:MAG: HIT domain-containing protein, partial [Clostridia bacterium]|nr:HIT domain-containing protein [Clostridia bacterium]
MKDCIFCKIVSGEIPSYKIYEDDFCLAFLDISNDVYGHTLVIPKKHYDCMMTCDNTTLSRIIETCKKIGNYYVKEKGFEGFNILNNTGKVAGQSVQHVHFHVLPRKENDGYTIFNELPNCGANIEEVCKSLKMPKENVVSMLSSSEDAVILYTDGACSGNPGAGGWAAILNFKGKEKILSGGEENTTNNRMELMAVIMGLESVKENQTIKVFSDSAY